jgi:hypothetical protein
MRVLRGILVVFSVMAMAVMFSSPASAETQSSSQQLHVHAKVRSHQTIVIDDSNVILEVSSNTNEEVTPRVYRNRIQSANEVPLTAAIYSNYRQLIPKGAVRQGILYKYSAFKGVQQFNQVVLELNSTATAEAHLAVLLRTTNQSSSEVVLR